MKGILSYCSFTKKMLALALISLLGGAGIMMVVIAIYGDIEELQSADAILVLGAGQIDNNPSPVFQARLDRTRELYTMKFANVIILTGGVGNDSSVSDAYIGRAYLMQRGIPEGAIVTEEKSRTTKQNLSFAREIMKEHNIEQVLLVSHDFHMMRAKKMAYDLGMKVFVAPVQTKNELQHLYYSFREVGMIALYLFFTI